MKKSKFITGLSVFSLIASGISLLLSGVQFFLLRTLRLEVDIQSVLVEALREKYGVQWSFEQVQSMLVRHMVFGAVSGLIGFFLGLALLKRRSWSRMLFIIALVGFTFAMVIAAVFSPTEKEGLLYWAGIGLTTIATVIHLKIILRLQSLEIRQEFNS